MSASIYALLADELDISEEKAQKLLSAMLREVKKRAQKQEDGVQLPDFGRFTVDGDTLAFSPSESLARAVNHRFEGLEPEDLTGAPGNEEDESEEEDDGPSTITLGYQAGGNFDPIEEENDTETADDESDEAPDTAEFQAPSVDDEAAADTDEFDQAGTKESSPSPEPEPADAEAPSDAPDVGDEVSADDTNTAPSSAPDEDTEATSTSETTPESASPDSESDETDSSPQKAEELYPFVEDVAGSSSAADEDDEEPADDASDSADGGDSTTDTQQTEQDNLSGIWDEVEKETREMPEAPPSSPMDDSDFEPSSTETSSEEVSSADESSSGDPSPDSVASDSSTSDDVSDEQTDSSYEADPAPSSPPSPPAAHDQDAAGISPSRILAAVLAFLLLGSGTWYILGQRGFMPGPANTVSALKARVASDVQDGSPDESADDSFPEAAQTTERSDSDAASDESDMTNESDPSDTESTSAEDPVSADTEDSGSQESDASPSSDPSASDEQPSPSPTGITPGEGGWALIVASRSNRDGADDLVDTYRDRFGEQQVPIDVLEATVNNSTRYRVGIGQFSSQSEAQRFLEEHQSELPDGAWKLRLQ